MILTDDENEFNYKHHHIMWHQERNFILYLTPKAGNSSLKKSILGGMGFDLYHEYPAGFKFVSPKNVYDLIKETDPKVIAFVRNPATRIYSCWADKMNVNNTENGNWDSKFQKGMTFKDFLIAVDNTPMEDVNIHARSMNQEMVYNHLFMPSQVFKFEEFTQPDGWDSLYKYFDTVLDIKLLQLPHLNKSQSVHQISDDERKLICNIYLDDFKLFDYLF